MMRIEISPRAERSLKRPPLTERQPRARPSAPTPDKKVDLLTGSSPGMPHHESLMPVCNLSLRDRYREQIPTIENKHLTTVSDDPLNKRDSQISTTSTGSKTKRKTHVGPWQLGRTLGKGATGRVRLAKHSTTGQVAAIKIVSKKSALKVQSESMANLDKIEMLATGSDGARKMPSGIEREVVIMKLIEHPHIVNLYDIWENHGEMYLVLEYVEGGELFNYVSNNGALPEAEAVRLFRQIIAGLAYCHRFNICHRDLKPENILLDANNNIKLADFGMAALQPADKWLKTSCGSPHYAAPEVITGVSYRGDVADIWSVGIILYAMLNGFLPFDGGDLKSTLRLVNKGQYYLPHTLSIEASDLVQRILQKHPENRITMSDIWDHPLLRKYERLHASQIAPDALIGPPPPLTIAECGRRVKRSEIDPDVLQNLHTLWHSEKLEELKRRLACETANHEKLFYWALIRFREEQLENYTGDILQYSASDYHHITQPQPKSLKTSGHGHVRRASQFSILSDGNRKRESYYKNPGTSTSKATQSSYDPYRASRTPIVAATADGTTITVQQADIARRRSKSNTGSIRHQPNNRLRSETPPMPNLRSAEIDSLIEKKRLSYSTAASRSTIASSRRGQIRKSVSYRRKVSFQHGRQQSSSTASRKFSKGRGGRESQDAESFGRLETQRGHQKYNDRYSSPSLPSPSCTPQPRNAMSELDLKKARITSQTWKDDTRKVSAELGKICEEAFNRSSVSSGSGLSHRPTLDSPATTISTTSGKITESIKNRPLPLTPALRELLERRQRIIEAWGDADQSALADMMATLDKRIQEESRKSNVEIRSASDPTHRARMTGKRLLGIADVSTSPNWREEGGRAASDPVRKLDATVRLVTPDRSSPARTGTLMKKSFISGLDASRPQSADSLCTGAERDGHSFHRTGLDTIEEDPRSPTKVASNNAAISRKWSWLGRKTFGSHDELPPTPPKKNLPPSEEPDLTAISATSSDPANEDMEIHEAVARKKKWFRKMFGKSAKREVQATTEHAIVNDDRFETESMGSNTDIALARKNPVRKSYPPVTSVEAALAAEALKPIEVNQNWFAKIFHIKPASRIIVMQVSKAKARKEIVKILRDWRRYGLKDVGIERRAGVNVMRGRVDAANYLRIKPVDFHATMYTVLERGRRANLSMIKFVQEKGAASSFYRVVDTLETVLGESDMLVADAERKKGILKGIKEAGL